MPIRNQNLIGQVFGHLTVIQKSKRRGKDGAYFWVCQCDCGRTTEVSTASLNSGHITSCGHIKQKNIKPSAKRHESQLGDKLHATNHTGYRNISKTFRNGRLRYRVAVVYDHHQYGSLCDTLEEAIDLREKLRVKHWPNYSDKN